eukprot:CAMPEP_0198211982 /NCGR_PEP_ID=MMETSP1445-20131203/25451_1 /TAXON_ID=36898 /ORGANISM="Pyramimonas sp., Strain CCMP2087" /LENGTH=873 /DNA_ID=CAMNT_0043886345 /DNA_START=316 /DNA_END=2937 /DNA_ORIENTATION=-
MAVARVVPRSRKAAQVRAKAVAEPLSEPLSEQLTVGGWQVDKFGGTCVGSAERIMKGAQLMIDSDAKRKLLVVSAMGGVPKVTDLLLGVLDKAAKRDPSFQIELDALLKKHITTANTLLKGDLLESFLKVLHDDVEGLRALLKAISIAGTSTRAFSDFVVGHGELWSAQMMSSVIVQLGGKSTWMDARKIITVVSTSVDSTQVEIDYEMSTRRLSDWFEANINPGIIVMTGFVAETQDGIPCTLKRNGSDYTATIVGNLLTAEKINIWTDVDGVYSADPRKVVGSVCLDSLSYYEAWELSYFGASVLHPQCTIPAMKKNIPVVIRNFFNISNPGTSITTLDTCTAKTKASGLRTRTVKGFATIDDVSMINVEGTGMVGVPGTASNVFQAMKEAQVNVVMISQASSEHSICFAVKSHQAKTAVDALNNHFSRELRSGLIQEVREIPGQCILAAVGQAMCATPGVSAILFSALANANVNVTAIAQGCSEYNLTVVVSEKDSIKALRAVHSRFYLSQTPMGIVLVGPGMVGKTLLTQLNDQMITLEKEFNVELKVMAIASGSYMHTSTFGMDLNTWEDEWKEKKQALDWKEIENCLVNSAIPNIVMVDCTASSDVANLYEGWLTKGFNVITPNKKAGSGDLATYQRLRQISRVNYKHWFAEATVGAGLPILSSIASLRDSGDKIHRIEGILSGTLSFIFNTYDGTQPFSQVVSEAKANGYTEPDPRDDLSGTDVARKVVILARESGLNISMEDVPVQSLVPAELMECSIDEFMQRLPEFDQQMADRFAEAASKGKVLRFVGVVDTLKGTGSVELGAYSKDHAFGSLNGSDNMVSFSTRRYCNTPLVVRGPGAGAEVTAAGVFSDLLKLAAYLGAPS